MHNNIMAFNAQDALALGHVEAVKKYASAYESMTIKKDIVEFIKKYNEANKDHLKGYSTKSKPELLNMLKEHKKKDGTTLYHQILYQTHITKIQPLKKEEPSKRVRKAPEPFRPVEPKKKERVKHHHYFITVELRRDNDLEDKGKEVNEFIRSQAKVMGYRMITPNRMVYTRRTWWNIATPNELDAQFINKFLKGILEKFNNITKYDVDFYSKEKKLISFENREYETVEFTTSKAVGDLELQLLPYVDKVLSAYPYRLPTNLRIKLRKGEFKRLKEYMKKRWDANVVEENYDD